MIKHTLAAVAASVLIAATPALARPMTATDMHMMHRLGAPSISPDGRYALFTLSTTDLAKNKRNNPVHLLDLTRPGATPQPVAALKGAHDATFGADGSIYYLAPVKDRDQLFRMTMGVRPVQMSDFGADISGFKVSEPLAIASSSGPTGPTAPTSLAPRPASPPRAPAAGASTTRCSCAIGTRGPSPG